MNKNMFLAVILLTILEKCLTANVLLMSFIPSPSHHIWASSMAKELHKKGYNVTIAGPFPDKNESTSNLNYIPFVGVVEKLDDTVVQDFVKGGDALTLMQAMNDYGLLSCSLVYESEGFAKLLSYPDNFKFDLVATDITLGECMHPLIHKFNYPPAVAYTPFWLPSHLSYQFGNHLHPSYIPWHSYNVPLEMTFNERLFNYLYQMIDVFYPGKSIGCGSYYNNLIKQKFGLNVNVAKITRHISLLLTNTHPALDYAQPMTPNIIPVGGLQIKRADPIADDLKDFLDNSPEGVIVFSLGTNMKSSKLGENIIQAFLKAFERLPYKIVWKFEVDRENLPKNVILRKWLPQSAMLSHKNVKLFIGHGGGLSTQEVIYHGKSFIGLPFCADQVHIVNLLTEQKVALRFELDKITEKYVYDTITEMLQNPIYAKNMKERSEAFRDQPQTPMELAVFYLEYVMRHKGAKFLNSVARDLSPIVSSSADVVLFLSICIGLILYMTLKITLVISKLLSQYSNKIKKE